MGGSCLSKIVVNREASDGKERDNSTDEEEDGASLVPAVVGCVQVYICAAIDDGQYQSYEDAAHVYRYTPQRLHAEAALS